MKKSIFVVLISLFLSGCDKDVTNAAIMGEDGSVLYITFYDDTANVTFSDKSSVLLKGVPMASGIKYANDEYEYSEWHGEIELKKDNKTIFKTKK
jgi:membrane-bound inhibitor of C-type lysozyme